MIEQLFVCDLGLVPFRCLFDFFFGFSFVLAAHSLFIGAREEIGCNFTRMETIQNVGAHIWCNFNDVRFEARAAGAIVLGEKLVGISKGQSKRKRRSAAMCDTRGKLPQFDIMSIGAIKCEQLSLQVYEETGYDITNLADSDAFIEGVLNYQYTRLYLIRNVPIETVFVPRTRKEIKCCEWFSIEHLPTHKTDPVSKNHLNINANSFFMIMPFVKRLKKWINEQNGPVPVKALLMSNGGQLTKKSKGDSGNASKNGATQPQQQQPAGPHASNNNNNNTNNTNNVNVNTTNQCHTNSPRVVFFKNNAVPRRQRHKSMGDLDAANVVTRESSSTETNQTPTAASVQTPNAHGKQQHVQNSGKRTGDGASQSSDGNGKTVGGKRKLFSGTAPDQVIVKRTSSPLIQLQPNSKNSNKTNANQLNGNAKPNSSTTGSAGKPENIKKKRNGKQWPSTDPNARAENIVTKLTFDQLMATATVSSGTDYQSENEGRQASGAKALSWQNIFNPPPLTQLLRNEPSINIWRNVRLNKDVIMNESMKNLL